MTYTLDGRDKDSFEIGLTDGQITVKTGTKLDYDGSKKSYTVTVTATDPSLASATIDVTINVVDVNEGTCDSRGGRHHQLIYPENWHRSPVAEVPRQTTRKEAAGLLVAG